VLEGVREHGDALAHDAMELVVDRIARRLRREAIQLPRGGGSTVAIGDRVAEDAIEPADR